MERRVAIAVLLALALATSGCVQAVTGDTITFEASPATVDGQTLAEHGFELRDSDAVTLDRTVQVPVLGERDVRITNHVRVYAPGGGADGDENATPAVLFLVSTPQAQVAGQGTNPLGRVPTRELVTRVASRGGTLDDLSQVGTTDVTTLGTATTVEKYATTTEVEGRSVETFVYVTRVAHGSDYVVAVALLPKPFASEEPKLFDLVRNVEHDGGEDA